MRIFVCIKQVPDTESKIRLTSDQSTIDETGLKWIVNPYDEFAVEEALKIKDTHPGSTVTILSVGPKKRVIEAIRTALAMGADDGISIDAPYFLDGELIAKALAKAIQNESSSFDYVFTGKSSIDFNYSAVSQALAEMLSIPHVTVVSKMTLEGSSALVEREVEGGAREVIQLIGPSLIAANKGLNSPRYASLPGIMKAKKKPIKELNISDLGIDPQFQKVKFKSFELPPEKSPTRILNGDLKTQVTQLVDLLKRESKVL